MKCFQHPYPWVYRFKLLGVGPDCDWSFRQHFLGADGRVAKRLQVISRVGNTGLVMESRTTAVTSPALLERALCYRLATPATPPNVQALRKLDATILNRVVGRIIGGEITIRIGALSMLADLRITHNQYVLENANVLDRALGAKGAAAQKNARKSVGGSNVTPD